MTQKELINNNPQFEGESQYAYSRRLQQIAELQGVNYSAESIRTKVRKMVQVERRLNSQGQVTSSVEKLQSESPDIPKGFVPSKITKTHTNQHWISYTKDKDQLFQLNKEIIEQSIKDIEIKPIKHKNNYKNKKILAITYTDVHIGMDTNKDNTAMYATEWNEKQVLKTIDIIMDKVDRHYNKHDAIHIRDLGDLLDGFNGETTRGGHKLPQNMSNQEAFLVASKFKIKLAKALSSYGVPLYFHNVVNDNHSGDFAELLNFHVQEVLKYMLPDSLYYIQRKFIEHYDYGVHSFVLSHGKDKKHAIKPLNHTLDKRTSDIIEGYFKHNKLKDNITFEKGDSHIMKVDKSKYYNYICHGALSPASEWVQTNFQKSRQMFSVMKVYENEKEVNPLVYEI